MSLEGGTKIWKALKARLTASCLLRAAEVTWFVELAEDADVNHQTESHNSFYASVRPFLLLLPLK